MHVLNWNPPQLPQYIGEGGARGEGIHLIVKRLKGGTIRAQVCKVPPPRPSSYDQGGGAGGKLMKINRFYKG